MSYYNFYANFTENLDKNVGWGFPLLGHIFDAEQFGHTCQGEYFCWGVAVNVRGGGERFTQWYKKYSFGFSSYIIRNTIEQIYRKSGEINRKYSKFIVLARLFVMYPLATIYWQSQVF